MKMDAVGREQLAAQIVAIMKAMFCRPEPEEMRQIIGLAEQQIRASEEHPESVFQAAVR